MDVEAYRRGDPSALAEVVDRCGPWVWALARRGFVCEDALVLGADRTSIRVLGAPTPDVAAELTIRVLSAALIPEKRASAHGPDLVDQQILDEARLELFRAGERAGRLVSLAEPEALEAVPAEVEDLDALMAVNERPALAVLPLDERTMARLESGREVTEGVLAALEERDREVVQRRFREGQTEAEVAVALDCGTAAVAAHSSRIRRRLARRLHALFGRAVGPAECDAFLAGQAHALVPPPSTWDRVRREILTRTFREEPAPYHRRLVWGLGALGLAGLLWGAMFLGWLPSPDDDLYPTPQVELRCSPACLPGSLAHAAVLAPRDATRFAIALREPDGEVRPLLVAPHGGTLRLPLGAQVRALVVPHPVRIPSRLKPGTEAIAVFSEDPLSKSEVLDFAAGAASEAGVLTATTSVVEIL
ncbi:MAG: hypothetical protein AAFU79_01145 [Myxococcota bacterium]